MTSAARFKSRTVTLVFATVFGLFLNLAGTSALGQYSNGWHNTNRPPNNRAPNRPSIPRPSYPGEVSTSGSTPVNDSDLVRAVNDRRNVNFVQAGGVVVSRILPDDTQGLPHQKWVIKLSNGKEVQAIYNSDMGQRVPVKVGTVMALGGEFKMTEIGPLIHWLHRDPRGTRPDGFVIVDGVRYGDN